MPASTLARVGRALALIAALAPALSSGQPVTG